MADRALEFYRAARAEIVQRIALREQVLLASVTANGVVAGLALKDVEVNHGLLLFIPWISLASTMALFRHDYLIRKLVDYITELRKQWRNPGFVDFDEWLSTNTLRDRRDYLLWERFLFAVVTCGPSIAALWADRHKVTASYGGAVFALVCTIAYFIYIFIRVKHAHDRLNAQAFANSQETQHPPT
jgi:hypothetical protein